MNNKQDILVNLQKMFDCALDVNMSGNGTDCTRMITEYTPDAIQEIQALRDKVEEYNNENKKRDNNNI